MAAYNKINQFVEDLGKGVHNLSTGALTIALTTTANVPDAAADAVLADITQIAYTNLSARVPTITSFVETSGTAKLILADLVLTASGAVAAFGNVVLYNDTPTSPADPLIAWWAYGSDVTLANTETFTIDFDATNGVLTIA
jgi:hypothetical protein